MSIDTTKLRELAQKATPGPWTYFHYPKYKHHHVSVPIDGSSMTLLLFQDGCQTTKPKEDAEYIAAANPATVLELLDEIDRLRSDVNGAAECIARQAQTIARLLEIEKAARNLAKVKGRHNSEQAMNQLLGALK